MSTSVNNISTPQFERLPMKEDHDQVHGSIDQWSRNPSQLKIDRLKTRNVIFGCGIIVLILTVSLIMMAMKCSTTSEHGLGETPNQPVDSKSLPLAQKSTDVHGFGETPNYPLDSKSFPLAQDWMKLYWQPIIQKDAELTDEIMLLAKIYTNQGIEEPPQRYVDFEKQYYEKHYNISKYTKQNRFCIVVASYQNVINDRYKFNLNSIFRQKYDNYHVVYIDDASPDGTGNVARNYIEQKGFQDKFTIIINEKNHGPMHNQRMAGKNHCKPTDLMLILDGDDAFSGIYALNMFNANFQNQDVWYIYTNSYLVKYGEVGVSRRMPETVTKTNSYREYVNDNFITGHMRVFYNQLFLQIPDSNMINPNTGEYFAASGDRSIMVAMNELAQERYIYIPQITYIYNSVTQLSEWTTRRNVEIECDEIIRKMTPNHKLDCLFYGADGKCIPANQLLNKLDQAIPRSSKKQ